MIFVDFLVSVLFWSVAQPSRLAFIRTLQPFWFKKQFDHSSCSTLFLWNYLVPHHGCASTMVATILRYYDTQCWLWTPYKCSASSLPPSLSPTSRKHRSFHSFPSSTRGVSSRSLAPTPGIPPSNASTAWRCTPQYPHPTRHMDPQRHTP